MKKQVKQLNFYSHYWGTEMIKVILPKQIETQIKQELEQAGSREIGGVLMGEHVSENTFRISDITIQRQGGTVIKFIRNIKEAILKLNGFFTRTNHQYKQYNYLGEWHSHPLFNLSPSIHDQQSMWDIVNDITVGANFAVLLLVKLNDGKMEGNITLFVQGYPMISGELVREELENEQ